jgi:hypothetical protein
MNNLKEGAMQCVEPLLSNDHEIKKYTIAVSRQRLCKHVPMAYACNNRGTVGNGVFYSVCGIFALSRNCEARETAVGSEWL